MNMKKCLVIPSSDCENKKTRELVGLDFSSLCDLGWRQLKLFGGL